MTVHKQEENQLPCDASSEERVDSREERVAVGACGRILGALFLTEPNLSEFKPLRESLEQLSSLDDWPYGSKEDLGGAWNLIQEGLHAEAMELTREYRRLFVGPEHFNAPPWGSVYLDKDRIQYGISLLELRQWMRGNAVVVADEAGGPEDHIGKMLVMMGWLAEERPELLDEYLAEHLMPWAPRYLDLLSQDAKQPFYEGLALLTSCTLEGIVSSLAVSVPLKKLFF